MQKLQYWRAVVETKMVVVSQSVCLIIGAVGI